jgi:hypothetical protein
MALCLDIKLHDGTALPSLTRAQARELYDILREEFEPPPSHPATLKMLPGDRAGISPPKPTFPRNPWERTRLPTDERWIDVPLPDRHGWTVTC